MHELSGKIANVSVDWFSGKTLVTFMLNEGAREMVDELRCQEKLTVKVGKFKKKRSLDANAYFHLLVNKIARKTSQSDDDVKRDLVCSYGTLARDDDGNLIGAMIPAGQSLDNFYPYTRNYKTEYVGDKEVNCYLFYKRTRDLDSAEFAHLIEGTITEAKELGIETKPQEEIDSLLNSLGGNK